MKIDIKSQHSLYVHIGDWTFYIDNSTNEQIVEKWKDKVREKEITDAYHSMLFDNIVEKANKIKAKSKG